VEVHAHSDIATEVIDYLRDDLLNLVGKRTPIGIAEHEAINTGGSSCLENSQRILGIALVAIKEVLSIEENLAALSL
jgi:hypothetical protein